MEANDSWHARAGGLQLGNGKEWVRLVNLLEAVNGEMGEANRGRSLGGHTASIYPPRMRSGNSAMETFMSCKVSANTDVFGGIPEILYMAPTLLGISSASTRS